jgi:hypothetical protein
LQFDGLQLLASEQLQHSAHEEGASVSIRLIEENQG